MCFVSVCLICARVCFVGVCIICARVCFVDACIFIIIFVCVCIARAKTWVSEFVGVCMYLLFVCV